MTRPIVSRYRRRSFIHVPPEPDYTFNDFARETMIVLVSIAGTLAIFISLALFWIGTPA